MLDYSNKKIKGIQAQLDKNMEPFANKYTKPDGYDIKGTGKKNQFDFNT